MQYGGWLFDSCLLENGYVARWGQMRGALLISELGLIDRPPTDLEVFSHMQRNVGFFSKL